MLELCQCWTQLSLLFSNFPLASVPPGDYDDATKGIIFQPTDARLCANITINDDMIVEPNEEFQVNFTVTQGVTIGMPSVTTVTIVDNDSE